MRFQDGVHIREARMPADGGDLRPGERTAVVVNGSRASCICRCLALDHSFACKVAKTSHVFHGCEAGSICSRCDALARSGADAHPNSNHLYQDEICCMHPCVYRKRCRHLELRTVARRHNVCPYTACVYSHCIYSSDRAMFLHRRRRHFPMRAWAARCSSSLAARPLVAHPARPATPTTVETRA